MARHWLFLFGLSMALAFRIGYAAEPDWSNYGQILARHLSERTVAGTRLAWLNYTGLKSDPAFTRAIAQIAAFPVDNLKSREEKLAFYINAYNILAIKTVLDHWPVESIKDVGNLLNPVWKRPVGNVGGNALSLDEIENDILRRLGEPRIHMAIVCASKSCPDLHPEPYTAAKLNMQLDSASASYLNNPTKGLRVEGTAVRVSKIFDWFAGDFEQKGGVEAFIRTYRPDLPQGLEIKANLPYDWTLNGE
jgi:hypothetical protein